MNFLNPDVTHGIVGFVLTLSILSYLIGDNPLYRVAVHIFVGATAGYAALIAFQTVIWPTIFLPIGAVVTNLANADWGAFVSAAIALLLSALFLLKTRPTITSLGSVAVAFMVGVGAAVAVGGAITGTLFPQVGATFVNLLPVDASGNFSLEVMVDGLIILVGTIGTLLYFTYSARPVPGQVAGQPLPLLQPAVWVGKVFIGVAFGVLYAGAIAASLAVFFERIWALQNFVVGFLS